DRLGEVRHFAALFAALDRCAVADDVLERGANRREATVFGRAKETRVNRLRHDGAVILPAHEHARVDALAARLRVDVITLSAAVHRPEALLELRAPAPAEIGVVELRERNFR